MTLELKRGNDQVVQLPNLRTNTTPPTYLNSATVQGTLYDDTGQVVPGYEDLTFAYVAQSNGTYEWAVEGLTFLIPPSTRYKLVVTGVQADRNFRGVYNVTVVD